MQWKIKIYIYIYIDFILIFDLACHNMQWTIKIYKKLKPKSKDPQQSGRPLLHV
jgi:hypothetical protein